MMMAAPSRPSGAREFFEGLLAGGGERAVREYIDAAEAAFGSAHVKAHKRLWADYVGRRDEG